MSGHRPACGAELQSHRRFLAAREHARGATGSQTAGATGHTLKLLAVIPEGAEAARFLRHLKLPAEPNDIVQVRGPPEALEPPDDWADFDPNPDEDIDQPFADWKRPHSEKGHGASSVSTDRCVQSG